LNEAIATFACGYVDMVDCDHSRMAAAAVSGRIGVCSDIPVR
jgi:hypothetical protein